LDAWMIDYEGMFYKTEKETKDKAHSAEVSGKQMELQRRLDSHEALAKAGIQNEKHYRFLNRINNTSFKAMTKGQRQIKAVEHRLQRAELEKVHDLMVKQATNDNRKGLIFDLLHKEGEMKSHIAFDEKRLKGVVRVEIRRQGAVDRAAQKEKFVKDAQIAETSDKEKREKRRIGKDALIADGKRQGLLTMEAKEVEMKQKECGSLRQESDTLVQKQVAEKHEKVRVLLMKKTKAFEQLETLRFKTQGEQAQAKQLTKDVDKDSPRAKEDVAEAKVLAFRYGAALRLQEQKQAGIDHVAHSIKGLNSLADRLAKQQRLKKLNFGCGWKLCPKDPCLLCPPRFRLTTTATMNRATTNCECTCSCSPRAALAPEGMSWADNENIVLGYNNKAVKEQSQMGACKGGALVEGCLNGEAVSFNCGCSSLYHWQFDRQQSMSFLASQAYKPSIVGLPRLPSDELYSQWYKVCKMGMPVFPMPCMKGGTSNSTNGTRASQQADNERNTLGESNSPTLVKNGYELHKGFWKMEGKQRYRQPAKQALEQARSCKKPGSVCNWQLKGLVRQLQKAHDQELRGMGMKWAPDQTQWVEHDAAHDMAHDPVSCQAAFISGLAVCNTGRKVEVRCDPVGSGINVTFSAGCDCQGIVAHGIVAGHMPQALSGVCAGTMETWSIRAQEKHMHTEPAERCAALVKTACDTQAASMASSQSSLSSTTQTSADMKVANFKQTLKTIEYADKSALREQEKLRDQLERPLLVYSKVPGFGMPPTPGSVRDADSLVDCQGDCDQRAVCQSFSFNKKQGKCSWAKHRLDYDDDFVLYIKKASENTENGYFTAIAGVKIGDDVEAEMQTGIHECKFNCIQSKTCTGFSYAEKSEMCLQTQVQVKVGSDWDYYEKKYIVDKKQLMSDQADADAKTRYHNRAVAAAIKSNRVRVATIVAQDKEISDNIDEQRTLGMGKHLEAGDKALLL